MNNIKEGKYSQEEYALLNQNHPELWGDSSIYMQPQYMTVSVQSCEKCDVCMQPELCASSLYYINQK